MWPFYIVNFMFKCTCTAYILQLKQRIIWINWCFRTKNFNDNLGIYGHIYCIALNIIGNGVKYMEFFLKCLTCIMYALNFFQLLISALNKINIFICTKIFCTAYTNGILMCIRMNESINKLWTDILYPENFRYRGATSYRYI